MLTSFSHGEKKKTNQGGSEMSKTNGSVTSIEQHPDYPFVKVGLLKDWIDGYEDPNEWGLLIDGNWSHCVYESKESALEDADSFLFIKSDNYSFALSKIKSSIDSGDIELALLMSERMGYAKGRDDAKEQLRKAVIKSKRIIQRCLP